MITGHYFLPFCPFSPVFMYCIFRIQRRSRRTLVLGGIFWILCCIPGDSKKRYFLLGVTAGLIHLTRADGLLWLGGALVFEAYRLLYHQKKEMGRLFQGHISNFLKTMLIIFLGYLMVMIPWYGRNIVQYGNLFSPGGTATLWITSYNQTFVYPSDRLSFANWLQVGWGQHFQTWLTAIKTNLTTALAVQGEIFLLPFILAGAWRLRKNDYLVFAGAMWLATLTIMSLVFSICGRARRFSTFRGNFPDIILGAGRRGIQGLYNVGGEMGAAGIFLRRGNYLLPLSLFSPFF